MAQPARSTPSLDEEKKVISIGEMNTNFPVVALSHYHEQCSGRLVLDPKEAKIEFGDEAAARLKLSPDGKFVLWPQPSDDPEDPQNWLEWRKTVQLIIITLAAAVPNFDSGIGIAALFPLAKQYHTTTGEVNDLTTNWSIFLLGWGAFISVMFARRYGRLPVLFWSQILALGFLVGCTFAPDLKTFAAMRCLTAFFGTSPQVTGLYIVTDMYPFHRQARKLSIWAIGFLISPSLSPFAFGFFVAKASWRWSFGIGSMYGALVLFLIVFFGRETMYDRDVKYLPPRPADSLRYRIETLVGVTGFKLAKYRTSWVETISAPFKLFWRPHLLGILIFEAVLFGFCVGTTVTNVVFLGSSPPFGYGLSQFGIAGTYAAPMIAVIIGDIVAKFTNDVIMHVMTTRKNGVFEAESRLWACYLGTAVYVCGFVILGAAFQMHLSIWVLVVGWAISVVGTMVATVAIYAYANCCFPTYAGEISALLNLARFLGGFSVAYYQVPWAIKHGALQTLGCEAAIVAGLFVFIIPTLQLTGSTLRGRFSC